MNRSVLAVLALGTAAASVPSAHAGEPVPGPFGATCTVWGAAVDSSFTHVLAGGPFFDSGTITCTIQHSGPAHADADAVARSATGTGVTYLAPTPVQYTAPHGSATWLCTQWTPLVGDPLYYHVDPEGPDGSHWSTDPASTCSQSRSAGADPEPNALDEAACPLFVFALQGTLAQTVTIDEQGDVYVAGELVWDCPPYGA